MIFNLISRLMGGILLDVVSFKAFFSIILGLSAFLPLTIDYVAHYKSFFLIYLALSYFVMGAIFVSLPIYYARVYGPETGSQAYSFFFTSNSISTLVLSYIVCNFQCVIGYNGMMILCGICSLAAFILLIGFLSE